MPNFPIETIQSLDNPLSSAEYLDANTNQKFDAGETLVSFSFNVGQVTASMNGLNEPIRYHDNTAPNSDIESLDNSSVGFRNSQYQDLLNSAENVVLNWQNEHDQQEAQDGQFFGLRGLLRSWREELF
jgi:hypothetical protein